MKDLMAQVYKTSFFETTLTFGRLWVKEARHSETKKPKCATSLVESVFGGLRLFYRRRATRNIQNTASWTQAMKLIRSASIISRR